MNFKKRLIAILGQLGLTKKFQEKSLSQEEFRQVAEKYQKTYGSKYEDDLRAEEDADADARYQAQLDRIHDAIFNESDSEADDDDDEEEPDLESDDDDETVSESDEESDDEDQDEKPEEKAEMKKILRGVRSLKRRLRTMASEPTKGAPHQVVSVSVKNINGFGNTSDFLFGVRHPLFSMKNRWNQIAANPKAAVLLPTVDEQADGTAFYREAAAYAKSLQKRYQYLQQNGMLDVKLLESGTYSTNYDGVTSAGLGEQFVVLRQDALIARVLKKRDLTQHFPVAYGYQDRSLVFNTFFTEVSQAYQSGEVFKGSMKIENLMGYVDDAMIKMEWGPMKELERMYIGYLNKEGSDPIKWTMIEFQLLHSLEQAQVEQNKRRVRGIYVSPEKGVAGNYLNAGTGILYTLLRYVHEYKLLPNSDDAFNSYTDATMLASVQEFLADIRSKISEDMDIDEHCIYLNLNHQSWWIKNVRAAYGKDTDFAGPFGALSVVPDTTTKIIWMPYLGKLPFMMLQQPGNLQFLENVPGEMLGVKMQELMENVRAWSVWKEGTSAAFTGRMFNTRAEMEANAYEWQQIFINQFATQIADSVDGAKGFWHITDDETTVEGGKITISEIANAKAGVAYCIECGSDKALPKVAKSGNFAEITSAFEAKAVGDYIMVILRSDGKFAELERCVNGVRTINTSLQPNVPGGR